MTTTTSGKVCKYRDAVAAKPTASTYALNFGNGIKLLVAPSGLKSWQVHYDVDGRHKADIVGRFPVMSVEAVKAKREEVRAKVREGGDPAAERKARAEARRAAMAATLRTVTEQWIESRSPRWSPSYRKAVPWRFGKYVFPKLGETPIARIDEAAVMKFVNEIGKATPKMAVEVRHNLGSVFAYAKRQKIIPHNPVADIAEDLPVRDFSKEKPRARVGTLEDARRVLWLVESEGQNSLRPMVFLAHRFLALTAVRKNEALGAQWSEFDEGLTLWTIPADRMKEGRKHVVPLAPQAREVLLVARALQAAVGHPSPFVFASHQSGVGRVVGCSLNAVMDRALAKGGMAKRHTPHGWRGTFSTLFNERDWTLQRLVETSLAHATKSEVGRRYDESLHLEPRRRLMGEWADMLLAEAPSPWSLVGLRAPDNVVQLRRAA